MYNYNKRRMHIVEKVETEEIPIYSCMYCDLESLLILFLLTRFVYVLEFVFFSDCFLNKPIYNQVYMSTGCFTAASLFAQTKLIFYNDIKGVIF